MFLMREKRKKKGALSKLVVIIEKSKLFLLVKTKTIIMPTEYSVDIDSPTDLLFAETLIKGKIVSFS